ncbi:TRAP transporter small permease [Sutcliffiella sp. NPDC057660]|uniref:TRAP transporter small permease n=1 Tax=Sutcliffiella sp. NPDC057660 TaxID=3346199 RepID=UPI003675717B
MNKVVSTIDRLNYVILQVIAIVFGLISILTIYQVFARYVLNSPLLWSEAIIKYSMIWIVLLGTAVALRKGLLISVEAVLFIVPEGVRRIMKMIIVIINIIFLSLLIKYGFEIMVNLAHQKTGALNMPVSWLYAAIPIGSILAILNCIAVLFELIIKKETGDQDAGTIIH